MIGYEIALIWVYVMILSVIKHFYDRYLPYSEVVFQGLRTKAQLNMVMTRRKKAANAMHQESLWRGVIAKLTLKNS